MSARVGFTASDAERQAADSAANYLNRALRIVAERLYFEKVLERDPVGFAERFAPLLVALIEVQAREYQSWVLFERLGALNGTLQAASDDLAGCLDQTRGRP
jgi:hypothetical protein